MKLQIKANGNGLPMDTAGLVVLIDGVNISRYLNKLVLNIKDRHASQCTLTITPTDIEIDADVLVALQAKIHKSVAPTK